MTLTTLKTTDHGCSHFLTFLNSFVCFDQIFIVFVIRFDICLFVTINTTCEVVYVGNDGYAGLRFVGLPEEFKSSIIEYVRKFATV